MVYECDTVSGSLERTNGMTGAAAAHPGNPNATFSKLAQNGSIKLVCTPWPGKWQMLEKKRAAAF